MSNEITYDPINYSMDAAWKQKMAERKQAIVDSLKAKIVVVTAQVPDDGMYYVRVAEATLGMMVDLLKAQGFRYAIDRSAVGDANIKFYL